MKVDKEITEDFIKEMAAGVYLPELEKTTRPCEVRKTGKFSFRIILTQGMNRQIRRMVENFGYRVRGLRRVRIMCIELQHLRAGEYREIRGEELHQLYRECGLRSIQSEIGCAEAGTSKKLMKTHAVRKRRWVWSKKR